VVLSSDDEDVEEEFVVAPSRHPDTEGEESLSAAHSRPCAEEGSRDEVAGRGSSGPRNGDDAGDAPPQ
jgi:hypothetical protein